MFYRNDGQSAWTEISYQTRLEVEDGWGSATADLDLDGDQVFLNRNPSDRGAVFVRPIGGGNGQTNRSSMGTHATTIIDVVRERYGAHGTGVQISPWLHVGLGCQSQADLEVTLSQTHTTVLIAGAQTGEHITVHEDGTISR